jgi:hypothetical protein
VVPADEQLLLWLRRTRSLEVPLALVANKADTRAGTNSERRVCVPRRCCCWACSLGH